MFPGFRNLRVGLKIGLGFGLVTLILLGAVLAVISRINDMNAVAQRVIKLRVPMVETSWQMINGVNHSLASLRGWMLLGESDFKVERHKAWSEEIDDALQKMKQASPSWTNPDNVQQLQIIEKEIEDFRKYQQEIEDISHTLENTPARQILFKQAGPVAKAAINSVTRMISLEMGREATSERKALLGNLADIEVTLSMALANIESYLMSGDEKFKHRFETLWASNVKRYGDLEAKANLLTGEQKTLYKKFRDARAHFENLAPKMIEIRDGHEWNKAKHWLGGKAAPIADTIKGQLEAMLASQDQLLIIDEQNVQDQTRSILELLVVLLFAGGLMSGVLGSSITRAISGPIKNLNRVVHEMAMGNLRQRKLKVESKDELGKLSENFNELLDQLQKQN